MQFLAGQSWFLACATRTNYGSDSRSRISTVMHRVGFIIHGDRRLSRTGSFFNNMAPDYTSEIFHPSHSRHNTRMSTYKLDLPFRKNVHGQKTLSYLGPKTWNSLPAQIKLCKNVNNFKHDIKNLYFKRLQKSDDSIFMYY